MSRPDIAYAVNTVSSFIKSPKKAHWLAVKRIMRYLKGSINLKLRIKRDRNQNVIGYSDADWANDIENRKSVTGCVFMVSSCAIS